MPLINKTKNEIIIENVRFADSFWKRLKGLMFKRKRNFNYALVFPFKGETRTGASIHMLFVFFPIDLVYLDRNMRVVDIARGIWPGTLNYTPKKNAKYLIELPENRAKSVRIGEILNFE